MNQTRIRYAKIRARKKPKPVPDWMMERIKKEAEEIKALYDSI